MARGAAAAFINGLTQGYEQGRKMYKDYELGQVMNAKPEEVTGYTAQDGEQLKAMSEAKDADGKPYYTIGNDDKGNYTVTPNFGEDPKQVAMKQGTRTSFLGNDVDGTLTPEKMAVIRNSKMADVLAKYDPLQAEAIRRGNKQAELMDVQIKGAERQDRLAQRQEDQIAISDKINDDVSEYTKSLVKMNADGKPAPFTDDDFVSIGQYRTKQLAAAGLTEQAMANAQTTLQFYSSKLDSEKKQREQDVNVAATLASRGDYSAAMQVYNKYLPNGDTATSIIKNKDGSFTVERVNTATGEKMTPYTIPNEREFLAGINSLADSKELLRQKQQEFQNQILQKQLQIQQGQLGVAQGHLGVSQASLAEQQKNNSLTRLDKQADINAKSEAAYQYEHGNYPAAQAAAIRGGINLPSPTPKGTGTDIKVDTLGNIIAEQKTPDGGAVVTAYSDKGERKGRVIVPPAGLDLPSFASRDAVEVAGKAGKIKSGQKVMVGDKMYVWHP